MKSFSRVLLAAGLAITATPSIGRAQIWTNWLSGSVPGVTVNGSLSTVGVTATGQIAGYQLTDGTQGNISPFSGFVMPAWRSDFNFWLPSDAYTAGGLNAPPPMGLIQFIDQGSILLTFTGGALVNPFIAINSLGNPLSTPIGAGRNTAQMTFGTDPSVGAALVSSNDGGLRDSYWLGGDCSLAGNVLTGDECSGVVQLSGTYTSLLITGTTENWYGFTIGAQSISTVPEPSTYALMAFGLAGLGFAARRRKRAA